MGSTTSSYVLEHLGVAILVSMLCMIPTCWDYVQTRMQMSHWIQFRWQISDGGGKLCTVAFQRPSSNYTSRWSHGFISGNCCRPPVWTALPWFSGVFHRGRPPPPAVSSTKIALIVQPEFSRNCLFHKIWALQNSILEYGVSEIHPILPCLWCTHLSGALPILKWEDTVSHATLLVCFLFDSITLSKGIYCLGHPMLDSQSLSNRKEPIISEYPRPREGAIFVV